MTEQVVQLRKEVEGLLTQINNVAKQNISLIREMNQLTDEEGQINSDLVKATEQFNYLLSKLNVKSQDETSENEEQIVIEDDKTPS